MKVFNCNWESVIDLSVRWDDVPVESRAFYLSDGILSATAASGTDAALIQPLIDGDFLTLSPSGNKLEMTHNARQFHKLLKSLGQHDVFAPDNDRINRQISYLKTFYTNEERLNLTENHGGYRRTDGDLLEQTGCARWLSRFLTANNPYTWNVELENRRTQPMLFDQEPDSDYRHMAKEILQELIHGDNPVTLTGAARHRKRNKAAKAVVFLLENIFVYLSTDRNTLKPVIGIHPFIHRFINAGKTALTVSDQPVSRCPPFLVDDLTTLLVGMLLKPIPVTQKDHEPYSRSVEEIASRFQAFPEECNFMHTYTDQDRVNLAVGAAGRLKLASLETIGKKTYLTARKKSKEWLKLPPHEKLEEVMQAQRNAYSAEKCEDLTRSGLGENLNWTGVVNTVRGRLDRNRAPFNIKGSVAGAFRKVSSAGGPVDAQEFLDNQLFVENPYFTLFHSQIPFTVNRYWFEDNTVDYREMVNEWYRNLQSFIINTAIPFGMLNIGRVEGSNQHVIEVNDVGHYFLGEKNTLPVTEDTCGNAIIVQPNFEIVFLGPDPAAEVQIGQFSDRLGSGIGTLFRLSRTSILQGASIGLDAGCILNTLEGLSEKPVPPNVKEQIKNWSAQCRRVTITTRVLFICPDGETALKVKSSGGDKVELISDTVVAVSDRKFAKTLANKLEKKGIFRNTD